MRALSRRTVAVSTRRANNPAMGRTTLNDMGERSEATV
ncbi:hypothetical protein H4W31_005975 [Plantactinospora soyae]|uniref:Uncharacterized protein n=1 Tax=Plantactinospora soyae TaxID=1544732 RepID=A0A927R0L1_9ACTN|nr:hypothetical protein [Plantactinospora soyae]